MKNEAWALCIIIMSCMGYAACTESEKEREIGVLDHVATIVAEYPDSALRLLGSVNTGLLTLQQYYTYVLHEVQAKDKLDMDISCDTMIYQVKGFFEGKRDPIKAALACFYCGRVAHSCKKTEDAMMNYLKAADFVCESEDRNMEGIIWHHIAFLHYEGAKNEHSIEGFKKARKMFHGSGNHNNEIQALEMIGATYNLLGKRDSALYYYDLAYDIAEKHEIQPIKSSLLRKKGVIFSEMEEYTTARSQFYQSIKLASDETDRAMTYANLAEVYCGLNRSDSACFYIDLVTSFIDKDDELKEDQSFMTYLNLVLSKVESLKGNYKEALAYYQVYTEMLQNILLLDSEQSMLEIQEKYNHQKVSNERGKVVIEKQRLLLLSSVLIFSLALIISLLFFRQIRNKHQMYSMEQTILTLQKMSENRDDKESGLRHALLEQLGIIRGVMQLEHAIAKGDTGAALVQRLNKVLSKLNKEIFVDAVNKIRTNFSEDLVMKYPALDNSEATICCLCYLGFDNHEISMIMKQKNNTIQQKKSNIRKKLNIQPRVDINIFLHEVM
ncbi:MAG: LuxR family transcriptional regulator [Bacteroidales bacterium]|jgi:tetratricopeptide (TPR) repeat protein|nr:LuxR family transcriptional regulator [Bacteroidales bacterium]